tara:strand:- start:2744 stop:3478 length:735 start_codon:yes stop_codon:yes gene_type:complete
MSTKADIVNQAYEEIRISGLTLSQGASGTVLGLTRLEDMMAQYLDGQNIDVNYNFEAEPDINSETNVGRGFRAMMVSNLSVRLVNAYGKDIPMALQMTARGSLNSALAVLARNQTRQIQPSSRMPRGSGNGIRESTWVRYSQPLRLPATEPVINGMFVGEILEYEADFSAWLGQNTIASFTILSDPKLVVSNATSDDNTIGYTVTAVSNTTQGVWQLVQINVTDSIGRVLIHFVNFEVSPVPEV